MEGAITQLQSLHLHRNGYNRNASTIPRQHKHHHHHHQQQPPPQPIHQVGWTTASMSQPPPNYNPNMRLVEMKKASSVNTQSESGGSSNGEASPPPESTPSSSTSTIPSRHNKQRLNGSNPADFNGTPSALAGSNSSGNLQMMIAPGQMHFQTAPPPQATQIAYRTTQPPPRQQQQQYQPNGEMILQFQPFMPAPQSQIVVSAAPSQQQRVSPSTNQVQVVPQPPFLTNKSMLSCFNCGSLTHTGLNCTESSMEDVTRNSVYKLDYTITSPPPTVGIVHLPATVVAAAGAPMTSSMSSTSSLNSQPPTQLESAAVEQSIPIIDLTQDTSSNSSSSSTSSIHGSK